MAEEAQGPLDQLNGRLSIWLARIAAVVLAFMALMTFSDVVGRYFFGRPFSFTVELTELAMGLIVYFGVGLTTHENGHVRVDFLTLRLHASVRAVVESATGLISLGFLLVLVWRLWLRAWVLYVKHDMTQVLAIEVWPIAFLMAAASILLLTGVLLQTIAAFRLLRRGRG